MRTRMLLPLAVPLLLAAQEAAPARIRLLPVDGKTGGVVPDLKPEDLTVKIDGKEVKPSALTGPYAGSVGWVLVFQPIRNSAHRGAAFLAAAELLDRLPDEDRVLFLVRDTKGWKPASPGFTANRREWVRMLTELPERLPESLMGASEPLPAGLGLAKDFRDQPSVQADFDALTSLKARIRKAVEGKDAAAFARGTLEKGTDQGLDNASQAAKVVMGEMVVLGDLLGAVAALPGTNQVLVFSRNEADVLSRPDQRSSRLYQQATADGVSGTFSNAVRDAITGDLVSARGELTAKLIQARLPIHSVAGASPAAPGNLGEVARTTGGFTFTFGNQMVEQVPGVLMSFRNPYTLSVPAGAPAAKPRKLEIQTRRPGVRLFAATQF